jgi:hypothetical protein
MAQMFFEKPILNSPYQYPARHWELDSNGQPNDTVLPKRRKCSYVTPETARLLQHWRHHDFNGGLRPFFC